MAKNEWNTPKTVAAATAHQLNVLSGDGYGDNSIESRATVVKHRPQQMPDNEMWLNDDRKYIPAPANDKHTQQSFTW